MIKEIKLLKKKYIKKNKSRHEYKIGSSGNFLHKKSALNSNLSDLIIDVCALTDDIKIISETIIDFTVETINNKPAFMSNLDRKDIIILAGLILEASNEFKQSGSFIYQFNKKERKYQKITKTGKEREIDNLYERKIIINDFIKKRNIESFFKRIEDKSKENKELNNKISDIVKRKKIVLDEFDYDFLMGIKNDILEFNKNKELFDKKLLLDEINIYFLSYVLEKEQINPNNTNIKDIFYLIDEVIYKNSIQKTDIRNNLNFNENIKTTLDIKKIIIKYKNFNSKKITREVISNIKKYEKKLLALNFNKEDCNYLFNLEYDIKYASSYYETLKKEKNKKLKTRHKIEIISNEDKELKFLLKIKSINFLYTINQKFQSFFKVGCIYELNFIEAIRYINKKIKISYTLPDNYIKICSIDYKEQGLYYSTPINKKRKIGFKEYDNIHFKKKAIILDGVWDKKNKIWTFPNKYCKEVYSLKKYTEDVITVKAIVKQNKDFDFYSDETYKDLDILGHIVHKEEKLKVQKSNSSTVVYLQYTPPDIKHYSIKTKNHNDEENYFYDDNENLVQFIKIEKGDYFLFKSTKGILKKHSKDLNNENYLFYYLDENENWKEYK